MMHNYTGQRLSFEGNPCTVRYVGKIVGKDGTWLGVEWDDDDNKGKHDGTFEGRRYFQCKPNIPPASNTCVYLGFPASLFPDVCILVFHWLWSLCRVSRFKLSSAKLIHGR